MGTCETNGNRNQINSKHNAIKNVKSFNHNRKDFTNGDLKNKNFEANQKENN